MAWETIPDAEAGHVLTARYLNKYAEDNLRFLWKAHATRVIAGLQNIDFGTWESVTFNGRTWDTDDMWTDTLGTRLTIPAGLGGRWLFEAGVSWEANVNGDRAFAIRANGTTDYRLKRWISTLSINSETGKVVLDLDPNEFVELMVWHSGPSTGSGGLNLTDAFLSAKLLGGTA